MNAEEFWQVAKNEESDSGFKEVKVLVDGVLRNADWVFADWEERAIVITLEDE